MNRNASFLTLAMLGLVGLLWGLNWPSVKVLLGAIAPFTLRAAAFTCAAVVLSAVAWALGLRMRPAPGEGRALFWTGAFVLFGFNMFTAFGQLLTPASSAAIIAYTMPAMTAGLSIVWLGERQDARRLSAIGLGIAGLAVLASSDFGALVAAPLGPLLMFAAAFSWAIGNVLMKVHRWTLPALSRAAWIFIVSAALAWPLALVFQPQEAGPWPSLPVLLIFAFHVGGPLVTCYLLWTILLGRLSATVAAISTLIAPVVGVLSSALLLDESLTWQKLVALALIVLSILLIAIAPRQPS